MRWTLAVVNPKSKPYGDTGEDFEHIYGGRGILNKISKSLSLIETLYVM